MSAAQRAGLGAAGKLFFLPPLPNCRNSFIHHWVHFSADVNFEASRLELIISEQLAWRCYMQDPSGLFPSSFGFNSTVPEETRDHGDESDTEIRLDEFRRLLNVFGAHADSHLKHEPRASFCLRDSKMQLVHSNRNSQLGSNNDWTGYTGSEQTG